MSTPLSNGGATLAPTPTHPHHLSRQPSKEDLELAENLNLLNHSHERPPASREADTQPENTSDPSPNGVEKKNDSVSEYHSLEDTLNYQSGLQNNQPEEQHSQPTQMAQPTLSTPTSTARRSLGASTPVNGQVCK